MGLVCVHDTMVSYLSFLVGVRYLIHPMAAQSKSKKKVFIYTSYYVFLG